LTVDDRGQMHVVAVPADEPNTWQWRLFIPQGHRYSWHIAAEDIPQQSVPEKEGVTGYSNEPYWERDNEVLVTAKLRQGEDGQWRLSVISKIGDSKNQMAGATLQIPGENLRWMTEISCTDGQVAGSSGVKKLNPHGPIILLQRRPCEKQPDGSYRPSPGPMPGFMIWLEEE
jgi:hypothetical protein